MRPMQYIAHFVTLFMVFKRATTHIILEFVKSKVVVTGLDIEQKHLVNYHLGKVSPTFPAALFSVDARFARKIERPQTGRK